MNVSVLAEACDDILTAARWYEAREPGLGAAPVEEIDTALSRISAGPERFPAMYRTATRALTRRFTYALSFLYDETDIAIFAMPHRRRDRGAISERLKE